MQSDTHTILRLKNLLRAVVRVTITDSRIFIGTFIGTDQPLNIVLINTEEFRHGLDDEDGVSSGRYVGQVMIPWRLVVKVEASGQLGQDDGGLYF